MVRVLGIERDEAAQNQLRILQPLMKLRQNKLADTLTLHNWQMNLDESVEKVLESDIVVFHAPFSDDWYQFIKTCRKHGKIIVLDYDDDPFNTNPMNPAYKDFGIQEFYYKWPTGQIDCVWKNGENGFDIERNIMRHDMFRACFKKADLITTTTDILAEQFRYINPNVAVLPNCIDFYYYRRYEMVKKEVRIGYQGGASHYEDMHLVKDALVDVLAKNENAKFIYFGDLRFKNLFQDIPTPRKEFHDWVKYDSYPYKLALMNLDIGICPIVDNVFNRNKSALKFLDYTSVGAATIASDIPPYSSVIHNEMTGLLVANDKKAWVDAMDRMIKDANFRRRLADNAYDFIKIFYDADEKCVLWRDAYKSILEKGIESDISPNAISAIPLSR